MLAGLKNRDVRDNVVSNVLVDLMSQKAIERLRDYARGSILPESIETAPKAKSASKAGTKAVKKVPAKSAAKAPPKSAAGDAAKAPAKSAGKASKESKSKSVAKTAEADATAAADTTAPADTTAAVITDEVPTATVQPAAPLTDAQSEAS